MSADRYAQVIQVRVWAEMSPSLKLNRKGMYMWQSRVEIEHYFIAYFDRIAAFEPL